MAKQDFTPMVPYMPQNPKLYHAYVPYQLDTEEFSLTDALDNGTLFVALLSPYDGSVSGGSRLC